MTPRIWLGGLAISREWNWDMLVEIINLFNQSYEVIIDIADIYGEGNALNLIIRNVRELPINTKLSVKVGLVSKIESGMYRVEEREYKKDSFYMIIENYIKQIGIENIDSIQLHSLPKCKNSYLYLVSDLKRLKVDFPTLKLGISNIEARIYQEFVSQIGFNLDIVQIHANLIEQRLIIDYKALRSQQEEILLNRVLCRGLLKNYEDLDNDKQSRMAQSQRVKSSLTKERLAFIKEATDLCKMNNTTLQDLSMAWSLLHKDNNIKPIFGFRTKAQVISTKEFLSSNIEALQTTIDMVECLAKNLPGIDSDIHPKLALEK